MIDKLEMLIALARERHFGRAAEVCGVAQPSLSSAIRALEDYYGTPLVLRGSRFQGLTPEGERLLERARSIVAEARAIRAELQHSQRDPTGVLRLGVIPAALTTVQIYTRPFLVRCPRMRLHVRSMTSLAIAEALSDFEIDVGISYASDDARRAPGPGFEALPLYRESWSVLLPSAEAPEALNWADLAGLRLCLLTGDMQNRRILDQRLAARGLTVTPVVEAASILSLVAQVQGGAGLATVLPGRAAAFFAPMPGLTCLPLPEDDGFAAPDVALIVPVEGRRGAALSEFLRVYHSIGNINHPTETDIGTDLPVRTKLVSGRN